jgi:hypothetical protein
VPIFAIGERGLQPHHPPWRSRHPTACALLTAALMVMTFATACSSSPPRASSTSVSPGLTPNASNSGPIVTAPTPSTRDLQARAAVTAFTSYWAAWTAAYRHPFDRNTAPPTLAEDFARYSTGSAEAETRTAVSTYAAGGLAWRGTAPKPRWKVLSIEPTAAPWPTVTLANCPTVARWHLVAVRNGTAVQTSPPPPGTPRPPYRSVVTLIRYHGQWVVSSQTNDRTRTCTAP